jgi:hypothetical protein
MIVRLVLWSLADSQTTVAELRRHLRSEAVDVFEHTPGLRFQAWISDEGTERWGAVSLWDSREAAEHAGLSDGARELIGKDAEIGEEFDLEAIVEGSSGVEDLERLGLAFES